MKRNYNDKIHILNENSYSNVEIIKKNSERRQILFILTFLLDEEFCSFEIDSL